MHQIYLVNLPLKGGWVLTDAEGVTVDALTLVEGLGEGVGVPGITKDKRIFNKI